MRRVGGTVAHADGPRVVAERRGRPQVTGAASANGRRARAGPRLAGARRDGGLRGPACASREARVWRWVRIWSITDVWMMPATMRIAPWQDGHASGSTSTICWRSAAVGPSPNGGWPRSARVGARGPWRVARLRRRVPPCPACPADGWHTSHNTASCRGPSQGCAPAPGPGTRAGRRSRCPPSGARTCPTGTSPPCRRGRRLAAPVRRDPGRTSARGGWRTRDHPQAPRWP